MSRLVEVLAPELGLPANERVAISCWLVGVGDAVIEGDRLVELLCGEITFDVSSPASGRLARIRVETDEVIRPGQRLGAIAVE